MRQIILLHFTFLMILQLSAQTKTVNIHGVVKDTSLKSIEISYLVDNKLSKWEDKKLDVVNGVFKTSIQIPFPVEMDIISGNRVHQKNFIYNDAEILIDTAGQIHLIGSTVQDEYEHEFLPFFQSNDKLFDSLQSFHIRNGQKYGNDFPKPVQDSVYLLREKFCYERAKLLGDYIKLHPKSYVALWNIYYFASLGNLNQYFGFEKLLSSFSNEMEQHSFISALKEKIRESGKMQAGQIFPKDFFKGYEEMQTKVRENNKYYLIDFWYSHCAPCASKFPRLKEIYNEFHGKGFDIISISVDLQKDEKDYVAAIKKLGLAWNHVWDKDGIKADKFNIKLFPTYILLDKEDRIINSYIQANELEAFLKENL